MNAKLFRNLIDANITPYAISRFVPKEDYKFGKSSIKEAFGLPIKYFRNYGIRLNFDMLRFYYNQFHLNSDYIRSRYGTLERLYNVVEHSKISMTLIKYTKKITFYYWDYLNLRSRIKDVYDISKLPLMPSHENIVKFHDLTLEVYNKHQEALESAKLKSKTEHYQKYFYSKVKKFECSDDEYSIIACKDLAELTREGKELHHCVGSYIDRVSEGKDKILFLRKKSDLETPFYTIDLQGKKLIQIHGKYNCNLSDELKPFINEWIKKFDIRYGNYNVIR